VGGHELGPIAGAELGHRPADVRAGGGGTHEQTLENLDVAQAVVTLIGHPMTLPTVAD
jgi:hypothetical protein